MPKKMYGTVIDNNNNNSKKVNNNSQNTQTVQNIILKSNINISFINNFNTTYLHKSKKKQKKIIMEEVFQIKKEIENLKENDHINISNINNNRSRLSMQVGNINNLLKSLNMNDIYEENRKKNEELDNENSKIKSELNIKISEIKNNLKQISDLNNIIEERKKQEEKNEPSNVIPFPLDAVKEG